MSQTSLHSQVRERLLADLHRADEAGAPADAGREAAELNNALRLLAKWRSVLIQNTVLAQAGTVVWQGPLKGLEFLRQSAEGCHVAKLLGCYEQPLQPHIEAAIQSAYPVVLNIGCAEGYYAVGMADTKVMAYDLDPNARRVCAALAETNGVADRVQVGELFRPADFAAWAGQRVLVLCDIEGAEKDLLDPTVAPALAGMDLIVESHEALLRGITQTLVDRFAPTHEITVVHDDGQRRLDAAPPWFANLAHLDQLLATWEWRSGPTPWLVMRARQAT